MNPSSEEASRAKQVAKLMAVSSLTSEQINDSQTETSNTDGSDQDRSGDEEDSEHEIKTEQEDCSTIAQFDGPSGGTVLGDEQEVKQQQQQQASKSCQVDQKAQQLNQQRAIQEAPSSQHYSQRRSHHHHHHLEQQQQQQAIGDCEEVKQVELFGVCIVALTINGKQRLCLAQISNTLLKDLSYNEIHNRRVALGITCIQCTPIQLEILRRAGAMPSSSRRCGMITLREAERLCRSFLVEEQPPELPENFYFTVAHRINYGCKGRFVPARYISSRAKCIECFYCGDFYSPNKFIFHSHRQPHNTDCNPPDSPNINSWRKHIDLDWNHEHSQDIKYAWEDVKSLFNGGTRRRAPNLSGHPSSSAGGSGGQCQMDAGRNSANQQQQQQRRQQAALKVDEPEQLIDVECDLDHNPPTTNNSQADNSITAFRSNPSKQSAAELAQSGNGSQRSQNRCGKIWSGQSRCNQQQANLARQVNGSSSLMLDSQTAKQPANLMLPVKRFLSTGQSSSTTTNKRFMSTVTDSSSSDKLLKDSSLLDERSNNYALNQETSTNSTTCHQPIPMNQTSRLPSLIDGSGQPISARPQLPFVDFLAAPSSSTRPVHHNHHHHQQQSNSRTKPNVAQNNSTATYPASSLTSNFIYSQLYTQLMQPQQASLQQSQQQQQMLGSTMEQQQLALRNHLWSSLLALQCNAGGNQQAYSGQQVNHCATPISGEPADSQACNNQLGHLISASQLYGQQTNLAAVAAAAVAAKLHQTPNQGSLGAYKPAQSGPFSLHKFPTETNDI